MIMGPLEDYDHEQLRLDISQAFRFTDKWSHEDRLNSVAYASIRDARFSLQIAFKNLTLTEAEVQQREKEKDELYEELEEEQES